MKQGIPKKPQEGIPVGTAIAFRGNELWIKLGDISAEPDEQGNYVGQLRGQTVIATPQIDAAKAGMTSIAAELLYFFVRGVTMTREDAFEHLKKWRSTGHKLRRGDPLHRLYLALEMEVPKDIKEPKKKDRRGAYGDSTV